MKIIGEIIQGKGIASGKNVDPETGLTNTIALQLPFFKNQGVPVEDIFPGTLNMRPRFSRWGVRYAPKDPTYKIRCSWGPNGETEVFGLIPAKVLFRKKGRRYGWEKIVSGFTYYPYPSTLKSHPDTTIEVLSPKIEGVSYGDRVKLIVPRHTMRRYRENLCIKFFSQSPQK